MTGCGCAAGRGYSSIDVHHHHTPPSYREEAGELLGVGSKRFEWTPQMSIDEMDANGVATAMTSISSPGVWWGGDTAPAVKRARQCNEYAARMAADFPGRFGVFASLPLPDVDASLREIEYALDTLHADGIVLLTNIRGQWLGDAAFAPVFDELERRRAVVYTHPTAPPFCENLFPGVMDSVIEYGTDTTRTIVSLLASGTAARCPSVRFIFSHGGGTLPFLLERFTRLFAMPRMAGSVPNGVLHEICRFYYETAQVAHRGAMLALREMAPLEQILFGSDYPYRATTEIVAGLESCGLDSATLTRIHRDNALALFPRFSLATATP
jgi:predicted TIM-barrel fold metal-dependent hydrolase